MVIVRRPDARSLSSSVARQAPPVPLIDGPVRLKAHERIPKSLRKVCLRYVVVVNFIICCLKNQLNFYDSYKGR